MKKIEQIFIVNPKAGNGKSIKAINTILNCAKEENKQEKIIHTFTKNKGNATTLAMYFSSKYPEATIYSVGGDGNLNEIVNGVTDETKIGIIPSGSGNDFYRVSKNIKGTKKINLGVVNKHKFINVASLGFDAMVANEANKLKTSSNSSLVYPKAIFKVFKNNNSIEYMINGENTKSTILAVANGKYYGNGIPINPNYDLTSNYLNIINVPKLNRKQIAILLLKLLKEKHIRDSKVDYYLSEHINVKSDNNLLCNIDGEIINGKDFDFKIIKDGLIIDNNHPSYVKKAINLIK